MTLDTLIALDDAPAKEGATQTLIAQILDENAAEPLTPAAAWARQIGDALIDEWLAESALGWIEDREKPAPPPLSELLHPMSGEHADAARQLYHRALLHHCHDGRYVLMDFLSDQGRDWGGELADYAISAHAASSLTRNQDGGAVDLLLGKLAWLAPDRVAGVARHIIGTEEKGPIPVSFRWQENDIRARLAPHIGFRVLSMIEAGAGRIGSYVLASASDAAGLIEPPAAVERLTEAAFLANLERLSPGEQRLLLDALVSSLPFLGKAIGTFLNEPLRRMHAALRY